MAKDKEQAAVEDIVLIPVTKDGETISVCPEQVEPHQRMGWTLVA